MKEHKKSKKAKRDALLDARWGTENEYAGATETEWDQWDQCAGTLEDDMEACRNGDYHLVGGMYGDFWGEVVLFGVEVNRGGGRLRVTLIWTSLRPQGLVKAVG